VCHRTLEKDHCLHRVSSKLGANVQNTPFSERSLTSSIRLDIDGSEGLGLVGCSMTGLTKVKSLNGKGL
jgi:hypothetical protein